jgi:putative redox protein
MDKNKMFKAELVLVNDRLLFSGKAGNNEPVAVDYMPPLGDKLGYTSLELFLLSFSSCLASSVLTFLRRMNKTISGFGINAQGFRKEEHPTCFSKILVELNFNSPDLKTSDAEKVIKMSEETYCPVWAMIKGNVEVESRINITS